MPNHAEAATFSSPSAAPAHWGGAVAVRSLLLALGGGAVAVWLTQMTALGDFAPVASSLALWLALVGAVVWAVRGGGSGKLGANLRLRFAPIDLAIALLMGLALRSAAVLGEMAASGVWVPQLPSLLIFDQALSPAQWFLWLIAPVAIAPVVEELFFRGVMQPAIGCAAQRGLKLGRSASTGLAVVTTAALFAGGHLLLNAGPRPVLTGTLTLLVGLICGTLTALTGRLGPAIGVHVVFNASGVALLLMGTFA